MSDAREPTIMKDLFGDPAHVMTGSHTMIKETNLARHLQMVIPELKLTKKVTADEEGTVLKLPSIVVKKPREVERRRFYLLSTDIEARGHMGSCPGYALLTSQREATGFRERIGMTISAGEARMETYKDRIAERERVRQRKRARVERGAGDVPGEPGDKYDELVAVRHADASGGYIIQNLHEEKRKRDIQVNERGSEATNEEQMDEWRKMVRFEHEAPNAPASSDPYVALEHLVSDETPSRPESVLVQKSFEHISALDVFHEKGERKNRCIGEVLERYRGEDAGYLKRSESDVMFENWTCLNAPERIFLSRLKILMDEKSVKSWKKSNHNIVMDEELVRSS